MKIQGRKPQSIGPMGPIGLPPAAPPPAAPPSAEPVVDRVDLASSTQVRKLREAIEAMPAVRAEKVESLRGQIEEGSYYVESDKLARKVVDDMLAEALLAQRNDRPAGS